MPAAFDRLPRFSIFRISVIYFPHMKNFPDIMKIISYSQPKLMHGQVKFMLAGIGYSVMKQDARQNQKYS